MKTKCIIIASFTAIALFSCAPVTEVVSTETALPIVPTSTPTAIPPTSTPTPSIEKLSVTQKSVNQFSDAMRAAGIVITADDILQQGLEIQVITGADGKQYEIATIYLDPDPNQQGETLEGKYPLLIKDKGNWEETTLKNLAQVKGMKFGAFLNLNKDFRSITIDNFETGNAYIDWNLVQPQKGAWDFSDPDYNIETAYANGMSVTANLIWARNIAEWAKQDPDLHSVMIDYITQVMNHYKGKVNSWNVYNEAHRIKDERDVFWSKLDIQGVKDAFSTARDVDPQAELLYSDFIDLEGYENSYYPPIIETIVPQLKQDGNIDGISLQVTGRTNRLDINKLSAGLEVLRQYNLPIHISEFSIIIEGDNTPENLSEQAKVGAEVVRVLKQYNVVEIIAFGLEDRLTNGIYKLDNANAGFWLKTDSGDYVPKPIVYKIMSVLIEP